MIPPWPAAHPPGSRCVVRLSDGSRHGGTVVAVDEGWVALDTAGGRVHLARAHVIAVGARVAGDGRGGAGEAGTAGDVFSDEEIRRLVDAFLEDRGVADLGRETGRSRAAIGRLHKAFECARGNLVEDQLPPAARALVPRVRAALTG